MVHHNLTDMLGVLAKFLESITLSSLLHAIAHVHCRVEAVQSLIVYKI